MTKLQIKLLSDNATMPARANATDAGYDIYAAETKILEPQEKASNFNWHRKHYRRNY